MSEQYGFDQLEYVLQLSLRDSTPSVAGLLRYGGLPAEQQQALCELIDARALRFAQALHWVESHASNALDAFSAAFYDRREQLAREASPVPIEEASTPMLCLKERKTDFEDYNGRVCLQAVVKPGDCDAHGLPTRVEFSFYVFTEGEFETLANSYSWDRVGPFSSFEEADTKFHSL